MEPQMWLDEQKHSLILFNTCLILIGQLFNDLWLIFQLCYGFVCRTFACGLCGVWYCFPSRGRSVTPLQLFPFTSWCCHVEAILWVWNGSMGVLTCSHGTCDDISRTVIWLRTRLRRTRRMLLVASAKFRLTVRWRLLRDWLRIPKIGVRKISKTRGVPASKSSVHRYLAAEVKKSVEAGWAAVIDSVECWTQAWLLWVSGRLDGGWLLASRRFGKILCLYNAQTKRSKWQNLARTRAEVWEELLCSPSQASNLCGIFFDVHLEGNDVGYQRCWTIMEWQVLQRHCAYKKLCCRFSRKGVTF